MDIADKAVILSPMAGFSDQPYRELCRKMGSGASITEFVAADAVNMRNLKTMHMVEYSETERPVLMQIFGNDPGKIIRAANVLADLRPDGIDINMGCSVRKVSGKGSGAALLKEPDKVKAIFKGLVPSLGIPVSAKIRLGWVQSEKNFLEIGRILEGEGCSRIFVHGRTRDQTYSDEPDWDSIGHLKQSVKIPVIGNGNIKSLKQAHEKMEQYKLNGILIGRAAMGNPWIFSGINVLELSLSERMPVIMDHLDRMLAFYGSRRGVVLFRKHLARYLRGIAGIQEVKGRLLLETDSSRVKETLLQFDLS